MIESGLSVAAPGRWRPARATWILLGSNALQSAGLYFFLPFLPIYAQGHGASSLEIGAMFTAGVAGAALAQLPGGWLADRYDRRVLVVVFQAVFALLFPLYLLPISPVLFIPLRFVHAALGGGFTPAALALLTDLSPREHRGRAFGYWSSSFMFGLLAGPAIGGSLALLGLQVAFWGATVVSLLAAATLLLLPDPPRHLVAHDSDGPSGRRLVSLLLPAMLAGGGVGYGIGVYDTVWSLYVHLLGGSAFVVGLSFTLFSLPVLVLSGAAGALSDRLGPRPVVLWSTLAMGVFGTAYGFIHQLPVLVGLGVIEGCTVIGGRPALQALVSRSVPASHQGRAQGTFQTSMYVFQGAGSLLGGELFGIRTLFAFASIGVACWLAALATPFLGRRGRQHGASL